MKGVITITSEEVNAIASKFLAAFLDPIGGRIVNVTDYYGSLKVEFTTEPEDKAEEGE